MARMMTWQTSLFGHRPLFVLLAVLFGGAASGAGQKSALTATEMTRGSLPAALPVIAATVQPVYEADDLLVEYIGADPVFVATLDARGHVARLEPRDGLSIFWPAMERALGGAVFDQRYAGQRVLVTLPKPVDPRAGELPALVLHHHENAPAPDEARTLRHQLPCDERMSAEQMIRQGRRLGPFPEDERHCYDEALKKEPRSVAALWAAILAAPAHRARMDWYDTLLRVRPEFYEVQMRRWVALREREAPALVVRESAPGEDAPPGIQLEMLALLQEEAREAKRWDEELLLRDRLAGLRLRAVSERLERPLRFAVAMELYELGLRLDGAGRPKDAVRVLQAGLALATAEREFSGEYSLLRLRGALGHALADAGEAQAAGAVCREAVAGAVSAKEIESEGLGGRGVLEARRVIFCGQPGVGIERLQKEAAAHREYSEIHRVLGDYAAATGRWDTAEREYRMWAAHVPAGEP